MKAWVQMSDWCYRLDLNLSTQSYCKSRNFHSSLSAVEILSRLTTPKLSSTDELNVVRSLPSAFQQPSLESKAQPMTILMQVSRKRGKSNDHLFRSNGGPAPA
ncbi:hypothetical protein AVEN_168033-1 [Araneus ventricosus]|uniref:Uncharacterized protein n=1 Tax=Araneus ventricosus TaxID=182803 RepID=A0A4Y2JS79_ARAVE|nr:hypothetical protein AVEN_168033-1 [Araneus ventricosus]